MKLLLALCGFVLSASAAGQTKPSTVQEGLRPDIGVEESATVGNVLVEDYRFVGRPGVRVSAPVSAHWGSVETVDLIPGDGLAIIREKKLKACKEFRVIMGVPGWDDCLIDMNDDGKFDRVSFNNVGGSKDLVPPVPYERALVEVKGAPGQSLSPNFRKQLIYTGSAGTTLTLSYREYNDDLVRPAFTESLTLPLGAIFPQKLAVKDHIVEIVAIDGMGLRYRLLR